MKQFPLVFGLNKESVFEQKVQFPRKKVPFHRKRFLLVNLPSKYYPTFTPVSNFHFWLNVGQ